MILVLLGCQTVCPILQSCVKSKVKHAPCSAMMATYDVSHDQRPTESRKLLFYARDDEFVINNMYCIYIVFMPYTLSWKSCVTSVPFVIVKRCVLTSPIGLKSQALLSGSPVRSLLLASWSISSNSWFVRLKVGPHLFDVFGWFNVQHFLRVNIFSVFAESRASIFKFCTWGASGCLGGILLRWSYCCLCHFVLDVAVWELVSSFSVLHI